MSQESNPRMTSTAALCEQRVALATISRNDDQLVSPCTTTRSCSASQTIFALGPLIAETPLVIERDEPVAFGGTYRVR